MFSQSSDSNIPGLIDLVKSNNITEIKKLIQNKKKEPGWHWQYSQGRHDVGWAVEKAILSHRTEIIKLFFDEGVDPRQAGDQLFVCSAVTSQNLELVKFLVEHGANIQPRNDYFNRGDDSAIREAIRTGQVNMVKYLLEKGATSTGRIGWGWKLDTFLGYAAKKGYIEIIESLLQHGAKKDLKNTFECAKEKYGAFIERYKNDYTDEKRQQLVEKMSLADEFHQSHYEEALTEFDKMKQKLQRCTNNYKKIISILMDYTFGIDMSPNDHSLLDYLSSLETIRDINFSGVSLSHELLTQANLKGAEDAIVSIEDLEKISDVNRREALQQRLKTAMNKQGKLVVNGVANLVPLWRAAEVGDEKAVRARLEAGIDPNGKDNDNDSKLIPIVVAAANGHEPVVDLLRSQARFDNKTLPEAIRAAQKSNSALAEKLSLTQDINQVDADGNTLLHHAVRAGEVEKVRELIDRGAEVNKKGNMGWPLHLAAYKLYQIGYPRTVDRTSSYDLELEKKLIEIMKILLSHGADPNLDNGKALEWVGEVGCLEAFSLLLPITTKHDVVVDQEGFEDKNGGRLLPWYTQNNYIT